MRKGDKKTGRQGGQQNQKQAGDSLAEALSLDQAQLSLSPNPPVSIADLKHSNLVIVLHRPQKLVNIGSVVRVMKNMGLHQLRLVAPKVYDPTAIDAIAHRSQDILETTSIYPTLDAAFADTTFVVGTTARRHGERIPPLSPRQAAPEILSRAQYGLVALLFGPEDNGLSSSELDRCHQLVTIPTDPTYTSLNLAQAVLIVTYELYMASMTPVPIMPHNTPAESAQLQQFFSVAEQALQDVQFFKKKDPSSILRTLRRLTHRAAPDTHELALLTAIAREVSHFVRRMTRE